jgi:hypothetical protein
MEFSCLLISNKNLGCFHIVDNNRSTSKEIEIDSIKKIVSVDNNILDEGQIRILIKNLDFDNQNEFFDWFSNDGQIFKGKLIYWS